MWVNVVCRVVFLVFVFLVLVLFVMVPVRVDLDIGLLDVVQGRVFEVFWDG